VRSREPLEISPNAAKTQKSMLVVAGMEIGMNDAERQVVSAELTQLNMDILTNENDGAVAFFEDLLDPAFEMERLSGPTDRTGFLAALKAGGDRRSGSTTVVKFVSDSEALVTCVVVSTVRGSETRVLNERAFKRNGDRTWRLVSWRNSLT
jgi:hypothetical protein